MVAWLLWSRWHAVTWSCGCCGRVGMLSRGHVVDVVTLSCYYMVAWLLWSRWHAVTWACMLWSHCHAITWSCGCCGRIVMLSHGHVVVVVESACCHVVMWLLWSRWHAVTSSCGRVVVVVALSHCHMVTWSLGRMVTWSRGCCGCVVTVSRAWAYLIQGTKDVSSQLSKSARLR
jgi:hypothetical protein